MIGARDLRQPARARKPTLRTILLCGVRHTAAILPAPSAARNAIDIQALVCSSQAGAGKPLESEAAAVATAVTTKPWPSENRQPDQRARRGRRWALKRVKPSIVAR